MTPFSAALPPESIWVIRGSGPVHDGGSSIGFCGTGFGDVATGGGVTVVELVGVAAGSGMSSGVGGYAAFWAPHPQRISARTRSVLRIARTSTLDSQELTIGGKRGLEQHHEVVVFVHLLQLRQPAHAFVRVVGREHERGLRAHEAWVLHEAVLEQLLARVGFSIALEHLHVAE